MPPLHLSLFRFALLLALAAGPATAPPAAAWVVEAPAPTWAPEDDPPLWIVTHEGTTVYLMGSVHMLRPEAYPLDEALTRAFEASRTVAFELDLAEMQAGAAAMMQRGSFQGAESLRDHVSGETFEELEARMGPLGIPPPLLEGMKPWMAALLLSALIVQEAGFEAESGIDLHFYELAREGGKEIVALETLEDQIDVFDGLPLEAQVAYLETTLDELDDAVDRLEEMTALWETGRAEELAHVLNESLEGHPELEERILHQRNRNWIPHIEELLAGPDTAIVIVGMGHLVGEGSVIHLLRERGYQVERGGGGG